MHVTVGSHWAHVRFYELRFSFCSFGKTVRLSPSSDRDICRAPLEHHAKAAGGLRDGVHWIQQALLHPRPCGGCINPACAFYPSFPCCLTVTPAALLLSNALRPQEVKPRPDPDNLRFCIWLFNELFLFPLIHAASHFLCFDISQLCHRQALPWLADRLQIIIVSQISIISTVYHLFHAVLL